MVLKKLGFGDTPPVRKKYPKIPISIIQSLNHEDIDDEGFEEMQSDDPNSSRNFVYHTTNNNKDDNDDIDNDESYEFDDPYSKDRLYAFPVSKYYLIFSFFIFSYISSAFLPWLFGRPVCHIEKEFNYLKILN